MEVTSYKFIKPKKGELDHEFHLVPLSWWPLLASIAFLFLTGGAAFFFHGSQIAGLVSGASLIALLYIGYRWWADCVHEAKVDKAHTVAVQNGLRLGMLMFIASEVMFFFAFFWSYFSSAIIPMALPWGETFSTAAGAFPPADIVTINPWTLPLFNTLLLLLSGTTVTWAHASLLKGDKKGLVNGLKATIFLGLVFTGVQALEYSHILHENFGFADNNYSSNFFMATGFHGLHVLIGTIFLIVCLVRAKRDQFSEKHHLGFEFAAWYWHFVDVVWLFLFVFIYVWGR